MSWVEQTFRIYTKFCIFHKEKNIAHIPKIQTLQELIDVDLNRRLDFVKTS